MEQSEYIFLASQAQKKAAESGYQIAVKDFKIGRIYPKNGKNSGYICFVADVVVDDIPTYLCVKAWSGKTKRIALFYPKASTKFVDYTRGTFRACGTTSWMYVALDGGEDFALVNEKGYRNEQFEEERGKV